MTAHADAAAWGTQVSAILVHGFSRCIVERSASWFLDTDSSVFFVLAGDLIPPPQAGTLSSSQAPQGPGISMPAPSRSAQRGNTSHDGARRRGLQVHAPAPAPAGHPGTVTGASECRQLQPCDYSGIGEQWPVCYHNSRHDQCLLYGREPRPAVNMAINPRQYQPRPIDEKLDFLQGLPAVPTSHTHQPSTLVGVSGPWNLKPRAPGLQAQAAQPSAGRDQHHVLQVTEHLCPNCSHCSRIKETLHAAQVARVVLEF